MPTYKIEITIKAPTEAQANIALEYMYYGFEDTDVEVLDGSIEEVKE